jgi:hypothetical protein
MATGTVIVVPVIVTLLATGAMGPPSAEQAATSARDARRANSRRDRSWTISVDASGS